MFVAVSTWSAPQPGMEAAFEEHYHATHVPLARRIPGTVGLMLVRTAAALPGETPAFYRAVVTTFADEAAFHAATGTPAWLALRADTASMVERFGVSLVTGMGEPETVAL